MKAAVPWVLVVAGALSGLVVVRAELHDAVPTTQAPAASKETRVADPPTQDATPAESRAAQGPRRNLLEYGGSAALPTQSEQERTFGGIPIPDPENDPDVEEERPRAVLVGFIRRASDTRAVLSLDGVVEVVGLGAQARGWQILAFDPTTESAQVRSPDGETMDLVLGVVLPGARSEIPEDGSTDLVENAPMESDGDDATDSPETSE